MIRKIKGLSEFPAEANEHATGDVISHLFMSTDLTQQDGKSIHVNLLPNSSHLEVSNLIFVFHFIFKYISGWEMSKLLDITLFIL